MLDHKFTTVHSVLYCPFSILTFSFPVADAKERQTDARNKDKEYRVILISLLNNFLDANGSCTFVGTILYGWVVHGSEPMGGWILNLWRRRRLYFSSAVGLQMWMLMPMSINESFLPIEDLLYVLKLCTSLNKC